MLTIGVEKDAIQYAVAWEEGELAGSPEVLDVVEAMVAEKTLVLVTPVGPLMAVTYSWPQTIVRALEDADLVVSAVGDFPEPSWNETEDVDY